MILMPPADCLEEATVGSMLAIPACRWSRSISWFSKCVAEKRDLARALSSGIRGLPNRAGGGGRSLRPCAELQTPAGPRGLRRAAARPVPLLLSR